MIEQITFTVALLSFLTVLHITALIALFFILKSDDIPIIYKPLILIIKIM